MASIPERYRRVTSAGGTLRQPRWPTGPCPCPWPCPWPWPGPGPPPWPPPAPQPPDGAWPPVRDPEGTVGVGGPEVVVVVVAWPAPSLPPRLPAEPPDHGAPPAGPDGVVDAVPVSRHGRRRVTLDTTRPVPLPGPVGLRARHADQDDLGRRWSRTGRPSRPHPPGHRPSPRPGPRRRRLTTGWPNATTTVTAVPDGSSTTKPVPVTEATVPQAHTSGRVARGRRGVVGVTRRTAVVVAPPGAVATPPAAVAALAGTGREVGLDVAGDELRRRRRIGGCRRPSPSDRRRRPWPSCRRPRPRSRASSPPSGPGRR